MGLCLLITQRQARTGKALLQHLLHVLHEADVVVVQIPINHPHQSGVDDITDSQYEQKPSDDSELDHDLHLLSLFVDVELDADVVVNAHRNSDVTNLVTAFDDAEAGCGIETQEIETGLDVLMLSFCHQQAILFTREEHLSHCEFRNEDLLTRFPQVRFDYELHTYLPFGLI